MSSGNGRTSCRGQQLDSGATSLQARYFHFSALTMGLTLALTSFKWGGAAAREGAEAPQRCQTPVPPRSHTKWRRVKWQNLRPGQPGTFVSVPQRLLFLQREHGLDNKESSSPSPAKPFRVRFGVFAEGGETSTSSGRAATTPPRPRACAAISARWRRRSEYGGAAGGGIRRHPRGLRGSGGSGWRRRGSPGGSGCGAAGCDRLLPPRRPRRRIPLVPENLLKKRKAYQAIKATQAKQALLNKRKVGAGRGERGPGRRGPARGCSRELTGRRSRQCSAVWGWRRAVSRAVAGGKAGVGLQW